MRAEQKAKELIEYFFDSLESLTIEEREITAVKFAIFHCDEMLKELKDLYNADPYDGGLCDSGEFYDNVKQKLTALYGEL